MAASTYLGNMILNGFLRAVAVTLPSQLWLSLHTADPGLTGASEVSTGTWPAYARQDLLNGGAIGGAFSASTLKATLNAHQMLWAAYDGTGTITVTHWSIWDAASGGNCLIIGELLEDPEDPESAADHKTLSPDDEFVIYPNKLGVQI